MIVHAPRDRLPGFAGALQQVPLMCRLAGTGRQSCRMPGGRCLVSRVRLDGLSDRACLRTSSSSNFWHRAAGGGVAALAAAAALPFPALRLLLTLRCDSLGRLRNVVTICTVCVTVGNPVHSHWPRAARRHIGPGDHKPWPVVVMPRPTPHSSVSMRCLPSAG